MPYCNKRLPVESHLWIFVWGERQLDFSLQHCVVTQRPLEPSTQRTFESQRLS
jgi:hypothetical protein